MDSSLDNPTPFHSGAPAMPSRRWQRLYFMLAGFDLLVVLTSLFITNQLVTNYRQSIHSHQNWVAEISEVAKLGISAFNVVSTSSNAFDSDDLTMQSQMVNEAIAAYEQHIEEVNNQIDARMKESGNAIPGIEATFEQVRIELMLIKETMAEIERDAMQMLDLLQRGYIREATLLLGPIDDSYTQVMFRINSVRDMLRFIQNEFFSKELDHANRLGKFEISLYLFVMLMVLGAIYYGRRLGRELEVNAKEREQHLRAIEANEQKFRRQAALLDEARDAMIVMDLEGSITFWNQGAENLYGWKREEVLGKPVASFLYADLAAYTAHREMVIDTGKWEDEQHRQSRSGERLIVNSSWTLVRGEQGSPQLIFMVDTDITSRKQAEEKIYHLAFHDQLTGMPNRELLEDRLRQAIMLSRRSHQKNALMFIDLDNFKELNDTRGHAMGDILLKEVAARLRACVRECDTVARFGGDEFVVVVHELGLEDEKATDKANIISEKIRECLSHPYDVQGVMHRSTPSIGVVMFDGDAGSTEDVLQQADLAMYRAKAAGRNGVCFYDSAMQTVVISRVALESDLKEALGKDEFVLYYQPQVNHHGVIFGAEGLLRWFHPVRGYVPPSTFIPLAEECGAIMQLGRQVLKQACQQLKAWEGHDTTRDLTLSVNVSAQQFHHADFVSDVLEVVSNSSIDPSRLKLELTESVLLEDVLETTQKMILLKRGGIEFALDDFGIGYSSLAYLRSLPLAQIKIDRSFIMELPDNALDASIVEAITLMGHKMGMQVIAEGVETLQQKEFLAEIGCLAYQGFLFARPMPAEVFTAFLCGQATPGGTVLSVPA